MDVMTGTGEVIMDRANSTQGPILITGRFDRGKLMSFRVHVADAGKYETFITGTPAEAWELFNGWCFLRDAA